MVATTMLVLDHFHIRQEGTQEAPAPAAPRAGGGEPRTVGSARRWPLHGNDRSEPRNHRVDHWRNLLRADSQHCQPRASHAFLLRRAATRFPRPSRLQHFASQPFREARRQLQRESPFSCLRFFPLAIGNFNSLYQKIGIDPPRGVLLYGPPGTGKTMLAKAVANQTSASFIKVIGPDFVQKYLGEGPRKVREVSRLARENAPAIIFIDEVDAIATSRFDGHTGADIEVQRTLMDTLNQVC
ncbi:hypothetical protein SASPL_120250 [Salvia splendens]|uniref:AAA+ ATPase domain-containing protein n=1 Tax=Salvia splendens TaxID=180675 RepID=A0A8X8ZTT5_SALSN|nr:hypothetical protein SASPL_120250 [Salvia splendens]